MSERNDYNHARVAGNSITARDRTHFRGRNRMESRFRSYLAEFVGTFALIFVGSLAAAVAFESRAGVNSAGIVLGALAHGFILMVMIYALGSISGCHINPAVTIALAFLRKISITDAVLYITFQLGGAIVGSLLHAAVRAQGDTNLGLPGVSPSIGDGSGFLLEAITTFFLVIVIIGTVVSGKGPAGFHGLAIGMTLGASWLIAGSLTGAALNPARHFGPAVVTGDYGSIWVYWAGPIAGALVAAAIGWFLFLKDSEIDRLADN